MASSALPLRSGDIVAATVRVGHVLGVGAMGAVFAAEELTTGRKVAVKCMLPKHAGNARVVGRFEREAYVTARLRSEHAVRILHYGMRDGAGRELPYIVMEALEGCDLFSLLQQRTRLRPSVAADYIAQACGALDEAHALGVVHRDIKLGNLFLTRAEGPAVVKVLDFGVAKFTSPNEADDGCRLMKPKAMVGTLSYMSPEQIADSADVDARTDIWSLGVTLFRLITGIAPFRGDTPSDIVSNIVNERPPPLAFFQPDVPPGLDAVVQQCLNKRREERQRNATELRRALARFVHRSTQG
jgi:eukaryotic-like serine/threonine-protein kinase